MSNLVINPSFKKEYQSPEIIQVILDNEISLVLQSLEEAPPEMDNEDL